MISMLFFCHKVVVFEHNTLNISVNEAVMSLALACSSFTEQEHLNIEIVVQGGGEVSSKRLKIFCGQL